MKQDKTQRRSPATARRQSSASSILGGGPRQADYFSFSWLLLIGTFVVITLISFLFTPYTHQLDEIKNVLLMFFPPIMLFFALYKMDFSSITWKRHGALMLLGLYFVWMWISWLVNPYKLTGEGVIWFNVGVATFTIVFAWYMNTENKVRKTMIFFVTLGFVSTLLGLFLYAGRYTQDFYTNMVKDPYWQTPGRQPWATLVYTLTSSHGDMYSFILNSDFYAAFLVMLIPISLSMFFVEQRIIFKLLALASLLLMNVCLILTNSNDSFIAMFLIAYPLYFLLGWRFVKEWGLSRRIVITFLACTAALLVMIAILMLPKLSAAMDFKSAAFEGRRVLWGGGFWPWIYGDHIHGKSVDWISIIFGTGPGGYRHYFPWFRRPDFFDQQINNVTTFSHNFYLDILLETGFVGLVLFIGFHVRVMADGIRQIRLTPSRTHRLYQLALITGIVGIAVQNFSSPNNRWAVAGMIYWCMFGLSLGLSSMEDPPVAGENTDCRLGSVPVHKIAWWSCMALAVLFAWRCIFPGAQFYYYWGGAKENAIGLRDMEGASYPGITDEQEFTQLASAMQHFKNAIEANPTFATSYYKLGHIYNRIGVLSGDPIYSKKAIETYETLDQINANYSEVHLNLGIMYAQQAGKAEEDRKKLKDDVADLKKQLDAGGGRDRGLLQKELDEKSKALKAMEGPLDEVQLKLMTTAFDEMKKASHQSLKSNTQYLTGSIGRELAMMYDKQGKAKEADKIKEQAKKYFRAIIEYTPMLEDLKEAHKQDYRKAEQSLLSLAQETNNKDETITVLKRMVHDNPDSELILRALLQAYDETDKPKEKLAYLEKAIHADPTDARLRQELADAYKSAGQSKKYIDELRRVEVLEPKDPALLKELYQVYVAKNDTANIAKYSGKLRSLGVPLSDQATTPTANAAAPTSNTATASPANATPTTASSPTTSASF